MFIDDVIWLPEIIEKLEVRHHVAQDEVEEVFFDAPKFRFVESGNRTGEDVYSVSGLTEAQRYLYGFRGTKTL